MKNLLDLQSQLAIKIARLSETTLDHALIKQGQSTLFSNALSILRLTDCTEAEILNLVKTSGGR